MRHYVSPDQSPLMGSPLLEDLFTGPNGVSLAREFVDDSMLPEDVDPFLAQFPPVDREAPLEWSNFPGFAEEVELEPEPIDWTGFPELVPPDSVDYQHIIREEFSGARIWSLFTEQPDGSYQFDIEHNTRSGPVRTGLRVLPGKHIENGGVWEYFIGQDVVTSKQIVPYEVEGPELEDVVASHLIRLCFTRIL